MARYTQKPKDLRYLEARQSCDIDQYEGVIK